MKFGSKEVGKFIRSRPFVVVSLVLLAMVLIISYLSYSSITRLQLDQNNLTEQYGDLALQHSNFQANYSRLQHNNTDIQSQLTKLAAQYNVLQTQQNNLLSQNTNLQSQHNELQSEQNNLFSQFKELQSQLSSLQTSYTQFMEEYPRLQPIADFSYLIFSDGKGNYFAENGITRAVDYSGTNGSQVAQNCLNALASSGGKIVFAGKINLDKPLIIQKGYTDGNLEISGFGPSTQLLVSQGSDGIHIIGDQAFGYDGPYHVVIRDLVLTTEFLPEGRFMNTGIYINNWFSVDIENVMVFYANNSGIFIEDSANVHINNVYVEGGSGTEYGGVKPLTGVGFWIRGSKDCYLSQCYSDTNEIGFLVDSNPNTYNMPRNVFLSQCEATLCNQKGILISNADGISVSDSLIEGSNNFGIMILDSFRINLMNDLIIGNVGNGITVTSQDMNMTQSEIRIIVCTINSNNKHGIEILAKNGEPISHVSIESCTIINSGTGARDSPDQPDQWDGINISNDPIIGGNCRLIRIIGCFIGNRVGANQTQNYGIRALQNSDYIQVFQNYFFNNTVGNYSLAGTNNTFENNISE